MRKEAACGALVALLVALGTVGSARAQGEHVLQYAPVIPARISLVSRSEITMIVMPTGQALPDTLTIEATRLEGATQFVDAAASGRYSIVLQYDSVRARMRPRGGLWQDLEVEEYEIATVRAVLNERLEVLQAEFLNSPHLQASKADMVRGLIGGVLVTLPAGPVARGDPWMTEVAYPLAFLGSIAEEEGAPHHGELTAHATAQIDSLAQYGGDTLYYVTVRGSFVPAPFNSLLSGVPAAVTVEGSFAAMLVWSSTWNAFISSAARAVLRMDIRDLQGGATGSQVRFDVITRSQVRL